MTYFVATVPELIIIIINTINEYFEQRSVKQQNKTHLSKCNEFKESGTEKQTTTHKQKHNKTNPYFSVKPTTLEFISNFFFLFLFVICNYPRFLFHNI